MIDRVVEVARPARLSVRDAQLVVACEGTPEVATPLAELAVLLLAHPQVTLSQAVLSRIAEQGGSVVTIDAKYLPAAMLLPVVAHWRQTARFAAQLNLSLPLRKRLWQRMVKAKIRAQGELLRELHGSDDGLVAMAARVRSGDPDNLEAQAARRYWMLVFANGGGRNKFRRGADMALDGLDQNQHLDYGYTVLRAAVARAICAAGLHPTMGLQHSNREDAFCLAADLMEPFRPLVDRRVYRWIQQHDPAQRLDARAKGWLIETVTARYVSDGEDRSLFDILARSASSLARAMLGGEAEAFVPPSLLAESPAPQRERQP